MMSRPANRDLLLVGGGHSHALALRMLAMKPVPGLRLTLISPDSLSAYSGMLPGLVAGHYRLQDTHIELRRLCQASGARFVRARVTALDPGRRRLSLDDGTTLDYDLLSLDVGATPNLGAVPGAAVHAVPVKPVSAFHQRWQALIGALGADHPTPRITVVGGGAGGTEMAMAVAWSLNVADGGVPLNLVTGGELLPGYPSGVRQRMTQRLAPLGIHLHTHSPVREAHADHLKLHGERILEHDFLLWCTGVSAPAWLAESGLPCDERGFLRVTDTLNSPADATVFAAGDCAAFPQPLPKAGVYAVRQAKVLAANLAAAAEDRPLRPYRPQRRFLSLLSAGGRDAVASRPPLPALGGGYVWGWKDRIDRAFMAKFEYPGLPEMTPAAPADETDPHCAGCGAKIGADALEEALADLQPTPRDGIEAGLDQADDAAVIRWPASRRLVQSLDYFPAFIDEPALFGRITALHSLSDLFAMNADPHSALATVCLPRHHPRLQGRDLRRLMGGALGELNAAGCTLVGGHTIEGPQMAAGFTVNGTAGDGDLWHKGGARPGDRLIATKALGTGIQLAAPMHRLGHGPWMDAALDGMLRGNDLARRALSDLPPHACTDITGFGLLGHLLELCRQSGVDADLDLRALRLLPGTAELVDAGVTSTLKPANDRVLAWCERDGIDDHDPRLAALTDPQTSGGLLFAVAPEHGEETVKRLTAAGETVMTLGTVTVKNQQAFATLRLHQKASC